MVKSMRRWEGYITPIRFFRTRRYRHAASRYAYWLLASLCAKLCGLSSKGIEHVASSDSRFFASLDSACSQSDPPDATPLINRIGVYVRYLALATILALGPWSGAWGQTFPFLKARDTAYVEKYHELLTVRPFVQARFTSLGIKEDDLSFSKYYKANTPLAVGIGIAWKMIGISYSMDIPFTWAVRDAPTRYFDFQYHYYGHWVVLDVYAFRYRGYFKRKEDAVDFFPKMYADRYGVRATHPLFGQHFSFAAAFEQSRRQRKWTFSFPVGLGVYYQHLEFNHPLTRDMQSAEFLGEAFCGAAIVYPFQRAMRGFYVAGEVTLGGSLILSKGSIHKPHPSLSWQTRTAFGYTQREWSLALTMFYHSLGIVESDNVRISGESGTLELALSWRFFRRQGKGGKK